MHPWLGSNNLRLVIIHYHLERGGVTQVINNHIQSLAASITPKIEEVLILHGGRSSGWPDSSSFSNLPYPVRQITIQELEYDDANSTTSLEDCDRAIQGVIREEKLTPKDTLFHFHNHSLGKNASLTHSVSSIAESGFHCLLQIHDFAEDFRPDNYQHLLKFANRHHFEIDRFLYPIAGHIHYAVLNSRDYKLLQHAGIPQTALHLLPNPVTLPPDLPDRNDARAELNVHLSVDFSTPYILYPVRGIRRKNLGELVLWSAIGMRLCPDNPPHFGMTLAPGNPIEQPNFRHWKAIATELGLPCYLGTAESGMSFEDSIAATDAIITTSVTEGFGMVFLEAFLNQKLLLGRDLHEITHDFKTNNIRFPSLYKSLEVPIDWIDIHKQRETVTSIYIDAAESYGIPAEPLSSYGDTIDFAKLSAGLQAEVVNKIVSDHSAMKTVVSLNPALEALSSISSKSGSENEYINKNKQIIKSKYGLANSGAHLSDIYQLVMDSPTNSINSAAKPQQIIQSLIQSETIYPIRHV